ncbi:putative orfan [Tupanvirus soda lake]|uniref:Orfan n=2 Tax=Tupanvirus TaxID=2094720 RepID=A0AC62ABG2_9VIRU|nr:putative orfan [Tupanvirus soda lake]QKU35079.1 putative orfan [Tupanvirus soda lake]
MFGKMLGLGFNGSGTLGEIGGLDGKIGGFVGFNGLNGLIGLNGSKIFLGIGSKVFTIGSSNELTCPLGKLKEIVPLVLLKSGFSKLILIIIGQIINYYNTKYLINQFLLINLTRIFNVFFLIYTYIFRKLIFNMIIYCLNIY